MLLYCGMCECVWECESMRVCLVILAIKYISQPPPSSPCHCPNLLPVMFQVVSSINILVKLMSVFSLFSVSCLLFFYLLSSCVAAASSTAAAVADADHYRPPCCTQTHHCQHLVNNTWWTLFFLSSWYIQKSLPYFSFLLTLCPLFPLCSQIVTFPPFLHFSSLSTLSLASTMQSWESPMPPPVSQWLFWGRAKGSTHSYGKARAGIKG